MTVNIQKSSNPHAFALEQPQEPAYPTIRAFKAPWPETGGYSVDYGRLDTETFVFYPQCVFIDNSDCATSVSLSVDFGDVPWIVTVAANKQIIAPIPASQPLRAKLTSAATAGETKVHFVNYPLPSLSN